MDGAHCEDRAPPAGGRIGTGLITPVMHASGTGIRPCPASRARFEKKPSAETAARFLADPRRLWNVGLFLMRVDILIAAAARQALDLQALAETSLAEAPADPGFIRLAPAPWAAMPSITIDHAIMEKTANLSVLRHDGGWSDFCARDAVLAALLAGAPQDSSASDRHGRTTAIGGQNSLPQSDHDGVERIRIGRKQVVAVATSDAAPVAGTGAAQSVRPAVKTPKARGAPQPATAAREHRPWGWHETIGGGNRFKVRRIQVLPGAALSLQSHLHRAEHWVVVQGTARVTLGETVTLVTENQSIYVPLGKVHRLENPGRIPMVLIEVQTGTYLGADDIIRHPDNNASA